jgi:hypothetical protein
VISDLAKSVGFEAEDWQWCARTNSTYLDCPISQKTSSETKMVVAVHNPANLVMNVV